jgi:hypothetical protein
MADLTRGAFDTVSFARLQPVNCCGSIVQKLALLRETEVSDDLAIGRIEIVKAAGKVANWQMAGKHRAAWPEDFDGLKDPWANLREGPVNPEDTFKAQDFDGHVGAVSHHGEVAFPARAALVREIQRPAHHGKHKLKAGTGRG